MVTNKQIRNFYNSISKKKYKKNYRSLSPKRAKIVRRTAIKLIK